MLNAQNIDTKYMSRKDALIEERNAGSCDCGPLPSAPKYVLQPGVGQGSQLRAGGEGPSLGDSLNEWWKENVENPAKKKIDEGADYVAKAGGEAVCQTFEALGILDEAQQAAQDFEFIIGNPYRVGNNAFQYIINVSLGGAPFLFTELVQECNFGTSIKNYAAAEYTRSKISAVFCSTIAGALLVPGVLAAVPTLGISTTPAAAWGAMASINGGMAAIYLAIARGEWVTWQHIVYVLDSLRKLDQDTQGFNTGELPSGLKDALEYSENIQTTYTNTQKAIENEVPVRTVLELEELFSKTGIFVPQATIGPQGGAQQPRQGVGTSLPYVVAPNPMVVRPTLIIPPADENTENSQLPDESLRGGATKKSPLPLIAAAGILLEVFK